MPKIEIPKEIEGGLKLREKREHIDEKTAARELLYKWIEDCTLDLYGRGTISLSRAAEILGKSVYDILREARKRGYRTGATKRQASKSKKTTERLASS